jgi:hypothetical protein
MTRAQEQQARFKGLKSRLAMRINRQLGDVYRPASDSTSLMVNTPDSMSAEIHAAVDELMEKVGNLDDYVATKLGIETLNELYFAFSAEQIDALALAIYNIEEKGEGIIIADQTGIGKGRIAAGMIRYAVFNNKQPIFMTEKPNLFSDIYRDLIAIGAGQLLPFIVNSREDKTNVKDENGNLLYQAPDKTVQDRIISSGRLPNNYHFMMLTYSQINIGETDKKGKPKPTSPKLKFLRNIAQDNIVILDESHNAAGNSYTGQNLQSIAEVCQGICFLSATFAKRSENMPIYAMKTCMKEANLSQDAITNAMDKGGVALQEIISADLVSQGQLIRRERTFEGVEINYIVTTNLEKEQREKSDIVTDIIRRIIKFQEDYIIPEIEEMDKIQSSSNGSAELRKGTKGAGVDAMPFVSKIFNSINQLLFAVKTDSVIERTLIRLKQGKKPIIAFSSTMESYIKSMLETNNNIQVGSVINADFSSVLIKALEGILRYTVRDDAGEATYEILEIMSLSIEAQNEYEFIQRKIMSSNTNLVISPIDLIIHKLEAEGYRVGEVTGRNYQIALSTQKGASGKDRWIGSIEKRKKENVADMFNKFNNNELDVLLINQAGSTGASAHAIITKKVSRDQVKQRVMVVAQPELDINKEVQKRGRVMRTGQIMLPIYDYMISAVPSEKRLAMMLQKKLKSLDANTTSNQKNSEALMQSDDFLNKYGDKIVTEFLAENYDFNKSIGNPLDLDFTQDKEIVDIKKVPIIVDTANKIAGRVAILKCSDQEAFYDEVIRRYMNYVSMLIENDAYDLEVETMDLKAETISREMLIPNPNRGLSPFSDNTYIQKCMVNVLRKPFTVLEVESKLLDVLKGRNTEKYTAEIIQAMKDTQESRKAEEKAGFEETNRINIRKINELAAYKKLKTEVDKRQFAEMREVALLEALSDQIRRSANRYTNEGYSLSRIFEFFKVGKLVSVPNESGNIRTGLSKGVVQGFFFGTNKRNQFAPSNISMKILMASSKKQLTIDLTSSNLEVINGIRAASSSDSNSIEYALDSYKKGISESSKERNIRYLISGNLLKFFGDKFVPKGKLVSYTNLDGSVGKGSLLPESYNEEVENGDVELKIAVPVNKIKILVSELYNSKILYFSKKAFLKKEYAYVLYVSKSRDLGSDVYLNKKILALVVGGQFVSTSSLMKAQILPENIESVLEIMGGDLYYTTDLNPYEFNKVKSNFAEKKRFRSGNSTIRANKPKARLPLSKQPSGAEAQAQRIRILGLEYKFLKK